MRFWRKRPTIRARKRRGLADQSGVAAVEFALLLPFLVFLYLGGVELLQGIVIQRQTTLTATTVANIVSQYSTISASMQMPDILNASSQILAAYSPPSPVVVVSLVQISSSGSATVEWSQATSNGTARTKGQAVTVPGTLDQPSTYLILSEVSYPYTPTVDFMHLGTVNLHASIFMVPRNSTNINQTS